MKKLLSTIVVIAMSLPSLANELTVNLGGSTDRTTTVIHSNVSYSHKDLSTSPYSQYVDFDSIYKSIDNKTKNNLYELYGKINYELDNKIICRPLLDINIMSLDIIKIC